MLGCHVTHMMRLFPSLCMFFCDCNLLCQKHRAGSIPRKLALHVCLNIFRMPDDRRIAELLFGYQLLW